MSPETPWLPFRTPNPTAQVRIFCFPYAGGNSLTYRPWRDTLPDFVEVCPVELPGHGTRRREAPLVTVPEIVAATADGLAAALRAPFALFGHSMGAAIAFELAKYLQDMGQRPPVGVFVSGREAPHVLDPDPPIYDLPDAEFLDAVARYNGIPEEVLNNDELMEILLPTLRADFTAIETHAQRQPGSPLNCPLTALGGLQDNLTREELGEWQVHTQAAFCVRMFAGDHFYLEGDSQRQLLDALVRELATWMR